MKYSLDLHTNESVKSIGLGLALIDTSTSFSGESLRMHAVKNDDRGNYWTKKPLQFITS